MYTDALTYPFQGDDTIEVLLIGSGLILAYGGIYLVATLLSFVFVGVLLYPLLLVPVLLLYGYSMAIFDTTIDGDPSPPPFDDWEELAKQGARMFGLIFVYQIPIWILLIGLVVVTVGASAGLDQATNPQMAGQAVGGIAILFVLLVMLFSLAISYVLPAALCSAASKHSIAAGFDVDALKSTLNAKYAIGWLLAAVVYVFIGTIGTLFSFLLVGVPILFYTLLVGSRLLAIGYRESVAASVESEPVEQTADGPAEGI